MCAYACTRTPTHPNTHYQACTDAHIHVLRCISFSYCVIAALQMDFQPDYDDKSSTESGLMNKKAQMEQ